MSLTPHANSVVTDRELTYTAHHVTLTIDRYDNIVHKRFVSCDAERSQNVGQMTDDSSFLLDSTKTSNMVSKHKSHSHISKSKMKFSVTPFQQILIASINALTKTVLNSMSSFDNKVSGFDNRMSNVVNEMSHIRSEMSNIRSEMSNIRSNLNDQRSNMDRGFSDFKSVVSGFRSDLKTDMSNLKTGLVDRMASFGSNIQSELSSLEFEFTDGFKSVRSDLAQNRSAINSVKNNISENESKTKARFQEVFSRFDSVVKELSGMNSKLDTRFDHVKSQFNSIRGELSTLNSQLHSIREDMKKLDVKCENKFKNIENKFSNFDTRISSLNDKFDSIDVKVTHINSNIESMDSKVDTLERKIDCIDDKVENINSSVETLTDELEMMQLTTGFMALQIKLQNDPHKKTLDMDKHVQESTPDKITIEKPIDINVDKIQDYQKMVDVRKAEIGSEFTKFLTKSSGHLDQKIEDLPQSLRSEVADLVQKHSNCVDNCLYVDGSLDELITPSLGLHDNVVGSMPTVTPPGNNVDAVSCAYVLSQCNPLLSHFSNSEQLGLPRLRFTDVVNSFNKVPERPSRECHDNDRDLLTNYGQYPVLRSQDRNCDARTFSPSLIQIGRRKSKFYLSHNRSSVSNISLIKSHFCDRPKPDNPSACYICGDHNHFVRNCPLKPHNQQGCYRCGDSEHFVKDCPNKDTSMSHSPRSPLI